MSRKEITIYSYEVDALVRARLPKIILDAMENKGWNAFGIYEVVKDELRLERIRLRKYAPEGKKV